MNFCSALGSNNLALKHIINHFLKNYEPLAVGKIYLLCITLSAIINNTNAATESEIKSRNLCRELFSFFLFLVICRLVNFEHFLLANEKTLMLVL